MNEWKECKLGDVAEIFDGPHATPAKTTRGVIFLSISNLTKGKIDTSSFEYLSEDDYKKWTRRVEPKENDILFSYETRLGEASIVPKGFRCCLGRRMGLLRIKFDHVEPKFLLYYYLGPQFQTIIRERTVFGTTVDRIPLIDMPRFPIFLPPLPEQRAIASVLSSLDDKIDLLHRQNKTLEAMAETLFRQWFVEEAEEGRKIEKLGDCVTISYGKNLPTKILLNEGFPVFGANGQIGFYERYTYEAPQVLVSCRGEASGKVNISFPKSFVTNNSLVLERNKRPEISFEYLKYWASFYDFNLHVSGSAQPQITIDGLYDAEFIFPDRGRIDKFTEAVAPAEKKRYANSQQIRTLETLRDTLLPKLMSGEVRVAV
ncbi:restriction endonuclease subunit S [Deltaproteobacteria bacterium TL4]